MFIQVVPWVCCKGVPLYVCTYVCTCKRACLPTYVLLNMCIYAYVHVFAHAYVRACLPTYVLLIYVYMYVRTCFPKHTYSLHLIYCTLIYRAVSSLNCTRCLYNIRTCVFCPIPNLLQCSETSLI